MSAAAPITVDVHLGPGDLRAALERDALEGLTASPKTLKPIYFYDDRGSALFDEITRLPEYYLTRAERSILEKRATEIADAAGVDTLVELGSGTSEKTRLLLDALWATGDLRTFAPFDVSEATLRTAAGTIASEYPGLRVHAVVGDFHRHLETIPRGGRRMVAFLGSTIGNFSPPERAQFLASLAAEMGPDDVVLLGADLVKEPARLTAAYDDSAGVTAAFNRNVLHVLNRELHADFDPDAFDHVAAWVAEERWMQMSLRARHRMEVHVADLGFDVAFEPGEHLHTEISAKFTAESLAAELGAAELTISESWLDDAGDFVVVLARPRA